MIKITNNRKGRGRPKKQDIIIDPNVSISLNNPGIYCINNERNGNKYVGQSKHLASRKAAHFQLLKAGKHQNKHLQRAYDYYGHACFKFVVLEITLIDFSDLDKREQFWIDELKPAYNMCMDVKNTHGGNPHFRDDYFPKGYKKPGETFVRPEWHKWVYGSEECPYINGHAKKL